MKTVYVICEKSGVVRDAFACRGWDAYSCDILPSDRGGKHFQCDCRELDYSDVDLVVAHPDCTYLANSGVWCLFKQDGRAEKMAQAALFFRWVLDIPVPYKVVENPIQHGYAAAIIGCKYDQIIQPYMFGDPESKATCLWLDNLPKLVPTNVLSKPPCGHWNNQTPSGQNKLGPSASRGADRARTYEGIAAAMADQFTTFICR